MVPTSLKVELEPGYEDLPDSDFPPGGVQCELGR